MKRLLQLTMGLVAAMTIATQALAVSDPVITGTASGTEYCFQFLCGAAIFAGDVRLEVDGKPRRGNFLVTVVYQPPLPTTGESVPILDGDWVITTRRGDSYKGIITPGPNSTITKAAGNNFTVEAELTFDGSTGTGTIYFTGALSHEQFPFTIVGVISQFQAP
jgi:hypothetical protein